MRRLIRNHGLKGTLWIAVLAAAAITFTACAPQSATVAPAAAQTEAARAETAAPAGETPVAADVDTTDFWTGGYQVITAKQAKQILDNDKDVILLDVREADEYAQGHIPNARLMPLGTIAKQAPTDLPDRDAKLMVYCRSGRRSKMAADTLLTLGYTHVLDMGGILDWPYDVVK